MEMGLLMIQDDFLAGLPGLTEARAASIRLAVVMKEKRLTLNKDKWPGVGLSQAEEGDQREAAWSSRRGP